RLPLAPLPATPPGPRLTQRVMPLSRSRTKTCGVPVVQGLAKFGAVERKAMRRPSALRAGAVLAPVPRLPLDATLSQVSVPVTRSRTRIWERPLVQGLARFVATDS